MTKKDYIYLTFNSRFPPHVLYGTIKHTMEGWNVQMHGEAFNDKNDGYYFIKRLISKGVDLRTSLTFEFMRIWDEINKGKSLEKAELELQYALNKPIDL